MDKKTKIILLVVAAVIVLVIAAKPFLKKDTVTGAISQNSNYAQDVSDSVANGQPVFLEFYSDT